MLNLPYLPFSFIHLQCPREMASISDRRVMSSITQHKTTPVLEQEQNNVSWSKYCGDARYTKQVSAVGHTLERFRQNPDLRSMMFISPTQAGKTTIMKLMIEAAREFWNISLENIVVFTGLADNAWRNQTVDFIKDYPDVKVFHRCAVKKGAVVNRLRGKKKLILLVDEAHFASGEDSLMDKVYPTLAKDAGFGCEKSGVRQYLEQYDVRIFDFSATPDLMLIDKTVHWDGYFETLVVEPGPGYYGIMDYLRDDRVRENFEMSCPLPMKTHTEQDVTDLVLKELRDIDVVSPYLAVLIARKLTNPIHGKFVGERIDMDPMFDMHHDQTLSFFKDQRRFESNDMGLPKYRYTIVRAPHRKDAQVALVDYIKDRFPDYVVYMIDEQWLKEAYKRYHTRDLNKLIFDREPQKPTIVFVKERLRVAKTITKTFLGDVFERWVPEVNNSTQIQGLPGRVTGYDRAPPDTLVYMNRSSAELYRKVWESGFKDIELLQTWVGEKKAEKHSLAAVTAYGNQERVNVKKQKTFAERVVSYGFKPAERIEIEGTLNYKQLAAYKEGYTCFLGVTKCDPEMERALLASYTHGVRMDELEFYIPDYAKCKNVFKVYASVSSSDVYYVVRYDGADEEHLKKCTWTLTPPALLEYAQTFFEPRGQKTLQVVSWNCAGQSETRAMEDFACRHGPHCDIIFLQECKTTSNFRKIWEKHNFFPHDDEKDSTWVVTLFRGNLKDKVNTYTSGSEHIRPYSITDGLGDAFYVCNVYLQRAQWDKDLACLTRVINYWKTCEIGGVIIGGDFNSGLDDSAWENAFHMSSPSFKNADPEHQRDHIAENRERVKKLSETMAKFAMHDASRWDAQWKADGRHAMTTWGGYKLDYFFMGYCWASDQTGEDLDDPGDFYNWLDCCLPHYSIDYRDELGVHGCVQSHRPIMLKMT